MNNDLENQRTLMENITETYHKFYDKGFAIGFVFGISTTCVAAVIITLLIILTL
jgi:hypothetical protein